MEFDKPHYKTDVLAKYACLVNFASGDLKRLIIVKKRRCDSQ